MISVKKSPQKEKFTSVSLANKEKWKAEVFFKCPKSASMKDSLKKINTMEKVN